MTDSIVGIKTHYTTDLTLSEAIRVGALLKPQGRGPRSMYDESCSCALGAALDALEVPLGDRVDGCGFRIVWDTWRVSLATGVDRVMPQLSVTDLVWFWNDVDYLTREQIADRVATIERQGFV